MESAMPRKRSTRSTSRLFFSCIFLCTLSLHTYGSTHPRLMADASEIARAKLWIGQYAWYKSIFDANKAATDRFISHEPIFVSPIKQTYQYQPYECITHHVELIYEEFR